MTTTNAITLDHTNFDVTLHDGMVTISNPASGGHRTFRIATQSTDSNFAPGKRVVSLLIGPDRGHDWVGFGFVDEFGVKVWRSKLGGQYETLARMLESPKTWHAKGAEYMVEARCRRCGRALTHPESIATGLGPVCAGKE